MQVEPPQPAATSPLGHGQPVPDGTGKKRRLRAVAFVEAGGEHGVVARADPPVGDREERVVDALEQRVVLLGLERPERVVVDRPAPRASSLRSSWSPSSCGEEPPGRRRGAITSCGDAGRLCADRDDRRARSFGRRAGTSHCPPARRAARTRRRRRGRRRADPAAAELVEEPVRGVGLVRQADLDVLGVARDPRVEQPRFARRGPRELDRLAEPAEAGRIETGLDRVEQLGDAGLRRILPLRLGDQVDLPAVQSLRHDLCVEATLGEPRYGDARRRASSASSSAGVASRRATSRSPSASATNTSEPRFMHR